MKIISLIVMTIFLSRGCDESSQDIKTAIIQYTANTRGFYQQITIQDQSVFISTDRSGVEKTKSKISDSDWKVLVEEFKEINLDDLAGLKAPSEKRFYDGAAIANLKVTYKGKEYMTADFDHGTPPAEIEKLVNKIVSFAKTE